MKTLLNQWLSQNEALNAEAINYLVYEAHRNKLDYLTLNYIEKQMIKQQGEAFMTLSHDKISLIIQLLLDDTPGAIYALYQDAIGTYVVKEGTEAVRSFNLVFMTYLHVATKFILAYTRNKESVIAPL